MTTACGICGAETNGAYICTPDTARLGTDLRAIPGALLQLAITYRGADVRTGPGHHRTPAGPAPLPWNEAAATLLRDLSTLIRGLARPDETDTSLERIALRRARETDLLRRHPDSPTYAKELHRLLDRATRVIDRRRTLWTFGICGCGQELTGEPDAMTVICSKCNTGHDAVALKERQWESAAGTLVTQAEAAQWLAIRYDVDPRNVGNLRKRVNLWVHRGRLTTSPGVVDGREQELVQFGSVDAQYRKVQAMTATKARRNTQTQTARSD